MALREELVVLSLDPQLSSGFRETLRSAWDAAQLPRKPTFEAVVVRRPAWRTFAGVTRRRR
ncbi:MAG: hypothetical protein OHK0013_29090 [Sandaracinaceae bacterium]